MNVGELVWKIEGDTKGIDKSLKSTDSKMAKFGKAVKGAFAVGAVVAFAKAAFDVSKKLVMVASDAEETANKFGVVFNGVSRAADAADRLAESYGLSHEASQNLLSGTADLLQGFGVAKEESLDLSEQVQQLAVDLSSFTNNEGGAEAASKALTSAMLGEREAVKSLGIAITDSELKLFAEETGQVFNEMTKGEKAILTLNLAIKQSGNAIGDFERSQDSFANQMKIARGTVADLHAVMGEDLLPVAGLVVTAFNNVVGALVDLRMEKINLDKALSGDKSANYEEALDTQIGKVNELQKALSDLANNERGARLRAGDLAALYNVGINGLDDVLEREMSISRSLAERYSRMQMIAKADEEAQARIDKDKEDSAERDRLAAEAAGKRVLEEQAIHDAFIERITGEWEALAETQEIKEAYAEQDRLALESFEEAETKRHEDRMAHIQAELAAFSRYAGNVGDIFSNLIQIQMAGDEELTDKKKKNIITLYRIQQAANIAQIAVDTAAGIVKAWANPGFPLAIPLTALIAGIGITQAAVVASTPPPVALAEGGIVPATPGGRAVIVGEGGQDEAVIPLDDAGGFGQMTFNLFMDSDMIASTTVDKINAGQYTINLSRGTV